MRFIDRLAAVLLSLALVLPPVVTPAFGNDLGNATWNESDSSNNAASPNGWTSGTMLPSQVEPTARAMAGAIKRWYDQDNATVASAGTANVQTLTYSVAPASLVSGQCFTWHAGASNTGDTTLNINAIGPAHIQRNGANLVGGEIVTGDIERTCYDGTNFQLTGSSRTGVVTVANNAALLTRSTTEFPAVTRLGFSAAGDTPPQTYTASGSACSLSAGNGDNGSQVKSADGKCWLAAFGSAGADFRVWGAVAGANVDNALDAAISWACSSHLPLLIPYVSNGYVLARAHAIGNGSVSTNSTCNGVTIKGTAQYPEFAASNNMMFQWAGSAGVIPITVQGPMTAVSLTGIGVDCLGICSTGFKADNTLDSEFGWLGVRGNIGPAFIFTSTPANNLWGGGFEGSWVHDIWAATPGTGGSGAIVGDTTCSTCTDAVVSSKFDNLHLLYDGQTGGTYALKLGFVSQSTFSHSRLFRFNSLGSLGSSIVIAPPPGGLSYPDDVRFDHVDALGPLSEGAGWVPVSGLNFQSWSASLQAFPVSSSFGKIWGTDAAGKIYPDTGTWTPTDASGAGLSLTTSDTRWYKIGKTCTISLRVVYPTTANPSAAQLAGIPTPCIPTTVAANATAGGPASYTTLATPLNVLVDTSGHISFYNLGTGYTNAGLSGKEFRASLSWVTD